MRRSGYLSTLVLLGFLPGVPSLAQTLTDPSALRFAYSVESGRAEFLESLRSDAAHRFLATAEEILALPNGPGRQRTELLGEAQQLADSIALLDEEIGEAAPAAREARQALIQGLEAQAEELRQAAEGADPQRRSALEARIRELEGELGELRDLEEEWADPVDPLSRALPTLSALARLVEEERAYLRNLQVLQDELRLFMGSLRLFDETGMPPSVRAEGGGDPDPGCPISSCPTDFAPPPADLPMEHFRLEAGRDGEGTGALPVTLASLARLQEQLSARAYLPEIQTGDPLQEDGTVTRETVLGSGLMVFRGRGEGRAGLGLKAGSSFLFSRALGGSMQLVVEPWVGGRSVQLDPGSSNELAAEIRQTLVGFAGGGRLHWQVTSWQKGRFLSDPLPLPAYLEPGRKEGGMAGRLALTLHPRWDLELGGGGDLVRYGPDEWKVLDRQGLNASMAVARRGVSNSARLSLMGSRHGFAGEGDPRREDTRMGIGADWSFEGPVVVRLSAGLSWNDSRLPAYDFRSGRTAVVVAAPWGEGTIQGYGALTHQSYLNPGPEDDRLAPSDQDRGSILAVQFTRPLDATRALALRAEWSRAETGFRDDFYQRFGAGIQVNFRGLGLR